MGGTRVEQVGLRGRLCKGEARCGVSQRRGVGGLPTPPPAAPAPVQEGGWARVGGGWRQGPPIPARRAAAARRLHPGLSPPPARPPPPAPLPRRRTAPAAPPPPARPPPALSGSLPVSLKCHRGAPGIAASKSRPTTQQRGHRSGAARARREPAPPGASPGPARPAPHPARRSAGPAPGPAGARRARAGGEDAAAAGRTARSARPAPPRALSASAPRAPEPGPVARALLRDRCRPSGRQGKGAARARLGGGEGDARPGPGARPAPASGTWGRLKFPVEAGQVARTREV